MSTLPDSHLLRHGPPANREVIGGKYVVEGILGEGGMGYVVAARHTELDELVALKFLRGNAQSEEVVGRFPREARASAKLRSEHAMCVFDVGSSPAHGPYIMMEHLEGCSAGQALKEDGPFSVAAAADIVLQVCAALAEAHGKGIVHRDVKPENIFLVQREAGDLVKVLDFGVSKAAFRATAFGSSGDLVKTNSLLGTPQYMSPEQMRAAATVDARSDTWSLGATLHELLAGGEAGRGGLSPLALQRRPSGEPPPLVARERAEWMRSAGPSRRSRAGAPPEADWIVMKCPRPSPGERHPTIGALAVALRATPHP